MIKIKLESILYNNDKYALEILKKNNLYKNIEKYEKPIEKKIVNEIIIDIEKDNTIDYMLKKLSFNLFEKIEKENNKKTYNCFYCFADSDKENPSNKNEIINLKKKEVNNVPKIEEEIDIDEIDINDEELSEIDLEDLEEMDLEELSDISGLSELEGGNKKEEKNKIFICKNCKKVYFMNKYF